MPLSGAALLLATDGALAATGTSMVIDGAPASQTGSAISAANELAITR